MTTPRITRRTALKGLGTMVALPWLEAWALAPVRAGEDAAIPTRMAVVYVPNGVNMVDGRPRPWAPITPFPASSNRWRRSSKTSWCSADWRPTGPTAPAATTRGRRPSSSPAGVRPTTAASAWASPPTRSPPARPAVTRGCPPSNSAVSLPPRSATATIRTAAPTRPAFPGNRKRPRCRRPSTRATCSNACSRANTTARRTQPRPPRRLPSKRPGLRARGRDRTAGDAGR